MNQSKLEERVRQIFEEQGFKVSKKGDKMIAENGQEIVINLFSSEKFEAEDIEVADEDILIFVDEALSEVQEQLSNEVSIISDRDDQPEYDIPSYELVGDIAVINELVGASKQDAVEGILAHHPRVETILLKKEGLKGEFRVGDYEKLHGGETETVHKEFGCRFKVDPTKVYFSERYGTERDRVVSQIQEGEKVLVMFAGVGPFAIMAARKQKPEKVVAVEKNPEAAKYLRQNVELNNVEDIVEVHEGDVEDVLPDLGKFDRIIMPLPGMADEFLDLAIDKAEEDAVIHYYRFLGDEKWENVLAEVDKSLMERSREYSILQKTVCGNKSPGVERICLDVRIE